MKINVKYFRTQLSNRFVIWNIILITAIAFAVRILRLESEGLWGDEILQIQLSLTENLRGGFRGFLGALAGSSVIQSQPPLSYAFVRLGKTVLGFNLWAFRLPSLFFGVAFVTLITFYWSKRSGKVFGFFAGLIPATYYWHVSESLQARPYSMMAFFSLAGIALWVLPFGGPWSTKFRWFFSAGINAFGILTNLFYFIGFSALSFVDLVFLFLSRDKKNRIYYLNKIVSFWLPGLLLFPYIIYLVKKQEHQNYHVAPNSIGLMRDRIYHSLVDGISSIPQILSVSSGISAQSTTYWFVALFLVSFILSKNRKYFFQMLFALLAVCTALGSAFSYGPIPWWGENYIILARVLMFWIFLSFLSELSRIKNNFFGKLAICIIALLGFFNTVQLYKNWNKSSHEDWVSAVIFMQTLPSASEIRFQPDWVKMNYFFIEELFKKKLRPLESQESNKKICYFSQFKRKNVNDKMIYESNNSVYGWCEP